MQRLISLAKDDCEARSELLRMAARKQMPVVIFDNIQLDDLADPASMRAAIWAFGALGISPVRLVESGVIDSNAMLAERGGAIKLGQVGFFCIAFAVKTGRVIQDITLLEVVVRRLRAVGMEATWRELFVGCCVRAGGLRAGRRSVQAGWWMQLTVTDRGHDLVLSLRNGVEDRQYPSQYFIRLMDLR